MKRAGLVITMILLISVFTGCMKTETNPDKDREEENTISVEDEIEALDWKQKHITAELSNNFSIDALIVPSDVYDKEIGLYKYSEFTEEDYNRETLIQALTVYNEKYINESAPEVSISVDSLHLSVDFEAEYTGKEETGIMDILDAFFPIDNQEGQYDKEKIESVINEFKQTVSGNIDLSGYSYRCLCWNQELRDKINKFAEEINHSGAVADTEVLGEDFYHIRIVREAFEGCFMEDLPMVSRPVLSGEQPGELTHIDVNGEMEPARSDSIVNIFLDKDYNILSYGISFYSKTEENPFATTRIVSAKDIIKSVYNKFKHSYKKVTIKDIRLVYSCYLDESLKEDNTREPYIAPYWVVTYYMEGSSSNYQIYYSAIDGALISSVL